MSKNWAEIQKELTKQYRLSYEELLLLDDVIGCLMFDERNKFDCKKLITDKGEGLMYAEAEISHKNGMLKYIDEPCIRVYDKNFEVVKHIKINYKNLNKAITKALQL